MIRLLALAVIVASGVAVAVGVIIPGNLGWAFIESGLVFLMTASAGLFLDYLEHRHERQEQ